MKVHIPLIYEREQFLASEEVLSIGRELVLTDGELLPAGFKSLLRSVPFPTSERQKTTNTRKEMSTTLLPHFDIVPPAIPSAGIYFFTTTQGIQYEVRFGRKENNILHATIVFGVINDEFNGEEYTETNKGEVYRVMATIVEILRIFMAEHPKMRIYEFTGIEREGEPDECTSTRTLLYKRYLPILCPESEGWKYRFKGSNVMVMRKDRF